MTVKGLCRWYGADYWGRVGQVRCRISYCLSYASLAWHYHVGVCIPPPVPITSSWLSQCKCHVSWLQLEQMPSQMQNTSSAPRFFRGSYLLIYYGYEIAIIPCIDALQLIVSWLAFQFEQASWNSFILIDDVAFFFFLQQLCHTLHNTSWL